VIVGKRSKRQSHAARDVHGAIREAAAALQSSPHVGFRDADELPEVAELMHAARIAVQAGVPRSFVFEGRRYWLRVRLAVQIDVFDSVGAGEPLIRGASLSTEGIGHAPGH
jgi:hypothetical protein